MRILDSIILQPRKKYKKYEVKDLRNTIDLMYCPKCNRLIQYRLVEEKKERICPYCKHFFVPFYSNRMKKIKFSEWDSPNEWEDVPRI
jgi:RNase P subunit RPR2